MSLPLCHTPTPPVIPTDNHHSLLHALTVLGPSSQLGNSLVYLPSKLLHSRVPFHLCSSGIWQLEGISTYSFQSCNMNTGRRKGRINGKRKRRGLEGSGKKKQGRRKGGKTKGEKEEREVERDRNGDRSGHSWTGPFILSVGTSLCRVLLLKTGNPCLGGHPGDPKRHRQELHKGCTWRTCCCCQANLEVNYMSDSSKILG